MAVPEDIAAAAQSGSVEDLLQACENFEIDRSDAEASATIASVYALHLLSELHLGNPMDAKFVWKRIPSTVKAASSELEQIWDMGRALCLGDSGSFFAAASGGTWGAIRPFVDSCVEAVRERTVSDLGRVYEAIPLSRLSSEIGLSEEDTAAYCLERGWSTDDGIGRPPAGSGQLAAPAASGHTIETLSSYVRGMEKRRLGLEVTSTEESKSSFSAAAAAGGTGGIDLLGVGNVSLEEQRQIELALSRSASDS